MSNGNYDIIIIGSGAWRDLALKLRPPVSASSSSSAADFLPRENRIGMNRGVREEPLRFQGNLV